MVDNIVNLKGGRAAGLDGLSAEHLNFAHPSLRVILAKLFQLMMLYSYIPEGYRFSYTSFSYLR